MSVFSSISKGARLKSAIKKVAEARQSEGGKAEQLFKTAYQGFAKVVVGDLKTTEALYNWGFALLHEAKNKDIDQANTLYLEAIEKFSFCLLSAPSHLGAAIDGGVAYMDLARIKKVDSSDELYDKAMAFFTKAEHIQKGSAAYNEACIYALRGDKEACLSRLETAKEYGSLPDEQEVMNDPDMASFKDAQWFQEFFGTVAVSLAEAQENDRRTRRGLKQEEEIKLDLPPRPTDSMLRRHYDTMVAAELEKHKEMIEQRKKEEQERLEKKKGDKFNYYK